MIAPWLGHESVETTEMYLHADLRQKEKALAKVTPWDLSPGRFRPDDALLAFLANKNQRSAVTVGSAVRFLPETAHRL